MITLKNNWDYFKKTLSLNDLVYILTGLTELNRVHAESSVGKCVIYKTPHLASLTLTFNEPQYLLGKIV